MEVFTEGTRVIHNVYGAGVVVATPKYKNDRYGVSIKFDSGYTRDNVGFYRASPENVTLELPINLENK